MEGWESDYNAHRPLGQTLMISMSSVKMNNCFCCNLVGNIYIYIYIYEYIYVYIYIFINNMMVKEKGR